MSILCVDTSAWQHSTNRDVASAWHRHLEADEPGLCDEVRLEILWFARSVQDYEALSRELGALRSIATDAATFRRALEVQRLLARAGGLHHRSVKIADLLIAAAAEAADAAVLHYDADFDRIAEVTAQPVVWIARRGSLSEVRRPAAGEGPAVEEPGPGVLATAGS